MATDPSARVQKVINENSKMIMGIFKILTPTLALQPFLFVFDENVYLYHSCFA